MKWMSIVGVAAALLIGAFLVWRRLRRRRNRMISFVALLREPVTFDVAILASVAGKAWNADLGDGTSEGADGCVLGAGVVNTIQHGDRLYLINCLPAPYVQEIEKTAAAVADLRIRSLLLEHQAWVSCDALGVDGTTPEAEVLDRYRRLGRLFAELLDENCLLIFVPDRGTAYAINEDTVAALRSDDPVGQLQATLTVPVIQVSDDDPLMQRAVQKARTEWPRFVSAFESRDGERFAVKAPVTGAGNTEFIWIEVTSLEGERIYGELANDPADLGNLQLGSKVSVPVADLNDWCYFDANGDPVGLFTVEAVKEAARRPRPK